jgi:AraC-like DNA-binding protein
MTTTPTTNVGSAGRLGAATLEASISGWAGPGRGAFGTLPWGRLRRVIEYIQQNLDKDLPLAELAALVCMSPYHFARLFKRSTGVPPHRFVIRQRIARASAILARPELSIAQISRLVGFRTASHFTTVFRHVTGITPKGYRTGYIREDRPGPEGG